MLASLLVGLAVLGPAQTTAPKPKAAAQARVAPAAKSAAKARVAKTVKLAAVGIALDLPKGWGDERTSAENEARMLLGPDGVTSLMLFSVPAKNLDGALGDLDKTLQGAVTDAKLDEPRQGVVGGMAAMMADGRGKVDGNEVDLGVLVVLNEQTQRVLFIVGFSVPGKGDYATDVAAILHSVRPMR